MMQSQTNLSTVKNNQSLLRERRVIYNYNIGFERLEKINDLEINNKCYPDSVRY